MILFILISFSLARYNEIDTLILERFYDNNGKSLLLLDAANAIGRRDSSFYGPLEENRGRPLFYDWILIEKNEDERHNIYQRDIITYLFIRITEKNFTITEISDGRIVDAYVKMIHQHYTIDGKRDRTHKYYDRTWSPVFESYYSGDPERVEDAVGYIRYQLDYLLSFFDKRYSTILMLLEMYQ